MQTLSCRIVSLLLAVLTVGCNLPLNSTLTPGTTGSPPASTEVAPLPTVDASPVIIISSTQEVRKACLYDAELENAPNPDDIVVNSQETIVQSWHLRNTGTCDWKTLTLVAISDYHLEIRSPPNIPQTKTGEAVELSLELTAPSEPGQYQGVWRLQTPDGHIFGPDMSAHIIVQATEGVFTPQEQQVVITDTGCILDADFVTDVTVSDGSFLVAGAAFRKIWRMQNIGTCDWNEGYRLVFVSGDCMDGPASVPVPPTDVGATADIAVDLTVPEQEGIYTSWWRLQSPDGTLFGVRPYVRINALSLPVNNPTPAPPAQSTYSTYIHNITARAREIYLDGQAKGNRANVFSKVGDSITDTPAFLVPVGNRSYKLHSYTYLQPVINYFSAATARTGNSFNNVSLAAVSGWNSFDMGNPEKVAGTCPGMTPLQCEYALVTPSLAIIMIGTNDATGALDIAGYHRNIQAMVEVSIESGVIPVLSTIPYNAGGDERAYNGVIKTIAATYDVPWMDFCAATWDLPNHGISDDGVHPSVPPAGDTANFSAANLQYGHTVRNLLVLHVLDAIWRQVMY
ncbi:MAG: hypothetical protein JXB30_19640 [Anaerolineae bacterium]|nr:hypothetical protein [Anaerolineae bacterium]